MTVGAGVLGRVRVFSIPARDVPMTVLRIPSLTLTTISFGPSPDVKTTRYFEEQVLRKRGYLRREWCERALREPVHREVQPDGRVRYWVFVPELARYLRVVTLADGETVLNAFPDRRFEEPTS